MSLLGITKIIFDKFSEIKIHYLFIYSIKSEFIIIQDTRLGL